MVQNTSLKYIARKTNFKNPRWRTADTLERPVLHHNEILQVFDFQDGACWNFEIKILTTLHFRDVFCIILLNFTEISRTGTFPSKMQKKLIR